MAKPIPADVRRRRRTPRLSSTEAPASTRGGLSRALAACAVLAFVALAAGLNGTQASTPQSAQASLNPLEPVSLIAAPADERLADPGTATLPALIPGLKSGRIPAAELDTWRERSAKEIGELYAAPTYRTTPCLEPSDLYHPPAVDSMDVIHYDIHYQEIDEASRIVRATTTITIAPLRTLTAVDLSLAGLSVLSVETRRLPDSAFSPTAYEQEEGAFRIGPFPPAQPGERIEIRVDFEGADPSCISLFGIPSGIIFSSFGAHTFSEPFGARHWFPCHDVPWDKATAKLTIDMAADRGVSATGVLVEDVEIGDKRRRSWLVEEPAATYLLAFYLGDFVLLEDRSADGIPLEYFVYPELAEKARVDFATIPEMMAFYSRFYPYPFARYAMTLGFFPGGMEHQTNSLIGWITIRGNRANEDLFAHELAHQWWGDLVTPATWRDIWLNEGFATYFDLLFSEHRYGWPALQRRMAVLDSVYQAHPDLDHRLADPPAKRVLSFVVYNKGARVLHMLRGVSRLRLMTGPPAPPATFAAAALDGDRRFFEIFSRYARDHAFGNATSGTFQAAAEAELGEDLTWFFHPWLYGLGYPRLSYDWRSLPSPRGEALSVRLRRTQEGETRFRMPVHVRYRSAEETLDEVRFLDGPSAEWSVDLPRGPWTVELDPDDWMLKSLRRDVLFPTLIRLAVAPNPSSAGFVFTGELGGPIAYPGRLRIHDVQGRLVAEWDLGLVAPGPVEAAWDGTAAGRRVVSGIYLARLEIGPNLAVRRLVVLPAN